MKAELMYCNSQLPMIRHGLAMDEVSSTDYYRDPGVDPELCTSRAIGLINKSAHMPFYDWELEMIERGVAGLCRW